MLAPGGYLLVSFQTGDDSLHGWREFDHKIALAYRWSLEGMAAFLAPAGLVEVARLRAEPGPSKTVSTRDISFRPQGRVTRATAAA